MQGLHAIPTVSSSPPPHHLNSNMPPSRASSVDIEALSGILGSISIACWVVVFSPQIVKNFRRSSADGLSLAFIIIWLLGDVFNILGAILQGVLPTMTILAIYYTLADIVLLGQCFYYQISTIQAGDGSAIEDEEPMREPTESSSLLPSSTGTTSPSRPRIGDLDRAARGSKSSFQSYLSSNVVDATHLSPATPFIPPTQPTSTPPVATTLNPRSALKSFLFNIAALVLVCLAGVLGWYASTRSSHRSSPQDESAGPVNSASEDTLHLNLWGQAFGYLCAVLYLGSRIPQLILNFRRKSTEGVSILFFLFACVGNLTYVLSIFAYEPACAGLQASSEPGCGDGEWGEAYGRYILVNASWVIGSAGTLVLDLMIFVQFWAYRGGKPAIGQD